MNRLLLKGVFAVLIALAAGLGVGLGLQLTGLRWPTPAPPPPRPTGPTTADIQRAFVGVADHLRPAVLVESDPGVGPGETREIAGVGRSLEHGRAASHRRAE